MKAREGKVPPGRIRFLEDMYAGGGISIPVISSTKQK